MARKRAPRLDGARREASAGSAEALSAATCHDVGGVKEKVPGAPFLRGSLRRRQDRSGSRRTRGAAGREYRRQEHDLERRRCLARATVSRRVRQGESEHAARRTDGERAARARAQEPRGSGPARRRGALGGNQRKSRGGDAGPDAALVVRDGSSVGGPEPPRRAGASLPRPRHHQSQSRAGWRPAQGVWPGEGLHRLRLGGRGEVEGATAGWRTPRAHHGRRVAAHARVEALPHLAWPFLGKDPMAFWLVADSATLGAWA